MAKRNGEGRSEEDIANEIAFGDAQDRTTRTTNRLTSAVSRQLQIAQEMNAAYEDGADSMSRMQRMGRKFGADMTREFKKTGKTTKSLDKAVSLLADDLEKMGKKGAFAAGVLRGMQAAAKSLGNAMGGLKTAAIGVFKAFVKFNVDLIMAPLKLIDSVMKTADKAARLGAAIANQSNQLANQFGGNAETIRSAAKDFKKVEQTYGNTFAYMTGEHFAAIGKAAGDMGNYFFGMQDQFKKSGESLANLSRVMNFGAEEMAGMSLTAITTGKSIKELENEYVQGGAAMSRATDVAQQVIAKDMAAMQGAVGTFGSASAQSLELISGRMRSLSSDFKTLGKVVDKFMNFDSAAKSAAQLGQAFGVNIDTMKMFRLSVKDPMKMLDSLRKSFFAAGKDASTMDAAQMRVLASSTNLSEEEAKLLFSMKNKGKSVKSLKKSAKDQLTDTEKQTAALSELGEQLANFAEVISTGGIFENLSKGFEDVMIESGSMGDFQNLNQVFYQTGKELGRVFLRLLDAGVFDKMMTAMEGILPLVTILGKKGGFFDLLFSGEGAKAMKQLDVAFQEVFGANFQDALENAAAGMVNMAAGILETVASLLEKALGQLGSGASQGKLAKAFDRLFSAWGKIWKYIRPHVIALASAVISGALDAIWEWVKSNPGKAAVVGTLLMGYMFGPMLVGMAIKGIAKRVMARFTGAAGKAAAEGAANTATKTSSIWSKMWGATKKAGRWAGRALKAVATKIGSSFANVARGIGTGFSKAWGVVKGGASRALGGIRTLASKGGGLMTRFGGGISRIAGGAVGSLGGALAKVGSTGVMAFASIGNMAWEAGKGAQAAADAGGDMWDSFGARIMGAGKGAAEAVDYLSFGMLDKMSSMTNSLGMGFNEAWGELDFSYIGETFSYMASEAWEWGKGIMTSIGGGISDAAGWVSDKASGAWEGIKGAWGSVTGWFRGNSPGQGHKLAYMLGDQLTGGMSERQKQVLDSAMALGGKLMEGLGHLAGPAGMAAKLGKDMVVGLGKSIKKHGVGGALKASWKSLAGAVKSGIGKAFGGWSSPVGMTQQLGEDMISGLQTGVVDNLDALTDIGGQIAGKLGIDAEGKIPQQIQNAMTGLEAAKTLFGHVQELLQIILDTATMLKSLKETIPDPGSLCGIINEAFSTLEGAIPLLMRKVCNMNLMIMKSQEDMRKSIDDAANAAYREKTGTVGKRLSKAQAKARNTFRAAQQGVISGDMAGDFMGTLGTILSSFQDLMTSAKEVSESLKTFNVTEVVTSMEAAVNHLTGLGAQFPILTSVLDPEPVNAAVLDLYDFTMAVKRLGTLFKGLDTMLGRVDMDETYNSVAIMTGQFKKFLKVVDRPYLIGWLDHLSQSMKTSADFAQGAADDMKTIGTSFLQLQYRATWVSEILRSSAFFDAIDSLWYAEGSINGMTYVVQERLFRNYAPKVWEHRIAEAEELIMYSEMLVQRLHGIKTVIEGIPPIHLRATIEDIKDNMSIVKEFTKVKDKPISIQFALDIHMDSNKLTKAILNSPRGKKILLAGG